MLLRNIFRNTFKDNFKNKRNICYQKNCTEEDNLFSTTLKVNFFTILSTLFINSLINSHNHSVNKQFNKLEDKINKLKDKVENKK